VALAGRSGALLDVAEQGLVLQEFGAKDTHPCSVCIWFLLSFFYRRQKKWFNRRKGLGLRAVTDSAFRKEMDMDRTIPSGTRQKLARSQ